MSKSYGHLSPEERDEIAMLYPQGVSLNDIAKRLKRSTSTVSREIQRNGSEITIVYHARQAQQRATERNSQSHCRPRLKNSGLRRYVINKIKHGWSPEQIAGRLPSEHPDWTISHEAIYQYIYDQNMQLEGNLVPYLARAHRKRQQKGHRHTHKSSHIPHRISINDRPNHILNRKQFGHWETDSVISRQSLGALNVTVERKSRYTVITKLNRKSAQQTRLALTQALIRFHAHARRTITYDNGSENVEHRQTNKKLGTRSYFCNPFHSWEKGTVENTIGLIRRVFPKKTDLNKLTKYKIKHLEHILNNRPRKCLSFRTPLEVFSSCCT
jgi:transposase, IS30 family